MGFRGSAERRIGALFSPLEPQTCWARFRYGQFRNRTRLSLVGRAVSTRSAENRALPVSDGCRERRTKRIWAPRAMAGRERSVYSSEPHHVLDAVATGRRITAMAPTAASRIVPPIVTGPTHIGPRPSLPAMPSTQPPTTTRRRTTASGPSRTREMGMFGIPTPPARPCSSATEILPGDAAADVEQMVLGVVECVSDDGGGVDHQLIDVNGGRSLLVGCE